MKKWLLAATMSLAILGVAACDAGIVPMSTSAPAVTTTASTAFSLAELSQYDGLNGHKGYIAVNGVVYDVSAVFADGKHQGMQLAGTDATAIFASSPHTAALLEELPVVGRLTTSQTTTTVTTTTIDTTAGASTTTTTTIDTTGGASTTTETTLPVFGPTELAQYDGKNGSPAYVAINGIVYDLSSVFVNGMHQGIQMGGTDASIHFESSPHSLSILEGMPVVGTYQAGNATNETGATLPVFTLAQLATYTGANGTTAYIAVNGVVYDVTSVFVNGTHRGMQLGGTDASAVFASSPHSASTLSSLPVVGSMEGSPTIPTTGGNTQTGTNPDDDEYDDDEMVSSLPQAILDYVSAQYPSAAIKEAEYEHGVYEVELNNGMKLKFDQSGQFLSMEWDD